MDRDIDPCNSPLDTPKGLHRVDNVSDFSKLLPPRDRTRRISQRYAMTSIGHSEENGSENSQVLFMKETTRKMRAGRSFSEISHNSARRMDGPSDGKDDVESDAAMEELVANIIDREIYEWQYVCETGRPYWWSPEQKYLRMRKHFPRRSNEYNYRMWMGEKDDSSKQADGARRQTVSEGYISDSGNSHTLAHMIAVQLLSSCFTLPPDCVFGIPPPNYPTSDKVPGPIVPDPRMISSLRMHTHFRFSPSFGHQARNTSLVPLWQLSFDGQSRPTSLPVSPEGSGFQTPDIGTSGLKGKRNRGHRRLHVTERSTMGSSVESDAGDHGQLSSEVLDPTVASTAWQRRRSTHDQARRSHTLPYITGHSRDAKKRRRKTNSPNQQPPSNIPAADEKTRFAEANSETDSRQQPSTNYWVQPVIRSEPHRVFVHPVRELVVKRWRTLRRRLGGSLHAPLADGASEDNVSTASESGFSGVSSLAKSNDGKARRQRAQERGDIHSSSVDSIAHYNSPVTRCATPENSGAHRPYWADSAKASPTFELADPLSAAAALAAAESVKKEPHSGEIVDASAPSSSSTQASSSPLPSSTESTSGNTYAKHPIGASTWPQSTSAPPGSFSRRGSLMRKSRLSEIHTPEEYHSASAPAEVDREPLNRSILSAMGSALASPKEDTPSSSFAPLRSPPQEPVSSPGPISHFKVEDLLGTRTQERPRLRRTSTSGTQIFHPDADGVEIDGLPVGPGRERWAKKGRRERTYL